MTILHGENVIKSRQRLVELIAAYKSRNYEISSLTAKTLTRSNLEEQLGGVTLFGADQVLIIEELHSLPESAKKKELIALISTAQTEFVLWEKRLLTTTMLKKFSQASVETFKASSIMFHWLDSLGSSSNKKVLLADLHKIFKEDGAFFCFTMLSRQVRLLISALDDGKVSGAPFIVAKLKKQSDRFSLERLITLHKKLTKIDYRQKRSLSKLSLEQELDLFVLSL